MANGNGGGDGLLGKLIGSLDNKLILLIVAGIVGISGNQLLIRTNPEVVRPNPWTSKMETEAEAKQWEAWSIARQQDKKEIAAMIELKLRPHEDHLLRADGGWDLIYENKEKIAVLVDQLQKLQTLQEQLHRHTGLGEHQFAGRRLDRLERFRQDHEALHNGVSR